MAIEIPVIFPGGQALPTGLPIFPDATVREEHGATYTITPVPIEGGLNVTNHVQPQPQQLVMDIVFSDTPDAFVLPVFNRAKAKLDEIKALFDTREPFDVWTSTAAYTSMVDASWTTTRTSASGNALVISVVLRKIEIALVDPLQVLADAALAIALGAQNIGSMTPDINSAIDGAGAVA